MSLLTAFMAAVAPRAASIIGEENLTIGNGSAVLAVLNEIASGKEFSEFGNDPDNAIVAVIRRSVWDAAYPLAGLEYINQKATARGVTFRVKRVRIGAGFVEVMIETPTKA